MTLCNFRVIKNSEKLIKYSKNSIISAKLINKKINCCPEKN